MSDSIFQNCQIYIVPHGLLKKRIKLFEEQIKKYGGQIVSNVVSTSPTHIIVEESYLTNLNQVKNILNSVQLKFEDQKCDIVGTLWLSRCLKEKNLLDTDDFKYKCKRKLDDANPTENEPLRKIQKTETPKKIVPDNLFDDLSIKELSINETVIEELQKLAEAYRATGDRWRTLAYDKAIASLKYWQKPISNINDLKLLPHISAKILDKISEIIGSGSCAKINEICNDEKTQILEMFGKIWGAGPVTAQMWYQKGYRTLEDLCCRGNLTWQQKLGLKYYKEIQELIPRQEVEQIVDYVKNAALHVDNSLRVIPCGSFRRGKLMCGDIDVLVIARNSNQVLQKILYKLRSQEFLIDDLSVGKQTSTKYLGLCKLPGTNNKIRRLDIFVISEEVLGCALLHYTGSAWFNRGVRMHASKMNFKLTEYQLIGLNGRVLPTPTEKSVFNHLKLEYKRPEDRAIFQI